MKGPGFKAGYDARDEQFSRASSLIEARIRSLLRRCGIPIDCRRLSPFSARKRRERESWNDGEALTHVSTMGTGFA